LFEISRKYQRKIKYKEGFMAINNPVPEGWEEVKAREIRVKFETIGDKVVGKLISIKVVPSNKTGTAQEAAIQTEEGIKKFFLTVDLERKLAPDLVGSDVNITFVAWQKTARGAQMKIFSVLKPTDPYEGDF
jgi:hypothetical protein